MSGSLWVLLRRQDSNLRPSGYEPDELPTAPLRDCGCKYKTILTFVQEKTRMGEHKSGFVNIIGNPNVGKSTLMNHLVGERISIVTNKAQTTRHRIHGIVSGDDFQIVYSDTPGILDPAYKMHEGMMNFVESSLVDADIILVVTEIGESGLKNDAILNRINKLQVPKIIVINKIDLSTQEEVLGKIELWKGLIPDSEVIAVSALHGANVEGVLRLITDNLPVGPAYFNKEELTDKPLRFFMSEIIREKIFLNYKKEIPYSCEVVIEEFKDRGERIDIRAEIFVERDSQKGIIIGHKGSMLKKVGSEARRDMEVFLGKKVFLDTYVKVNKDWRSKDSQLKKYGYLN